MRITRQGHGARRIVRWGGLALLGLLLVATAPGMGETAQEHEAPGTLEFTGKNAFATANGIFHEWRVSEKEVDLANLAESWIAIEVSLASVDTQSRRRDDHLRTEDFFEVERFPMARVRVHSARPIEAGESGRARFSIRYDIDLHGVEKTLEGEVELVSESPLVFEGELVVNRMDFGIGSPPSRWNPMSIKAEIPVHFRVEL